MPCSEGESNRTSFGLIAGQPGDRSTAVLRLIRMDSRGNIHLAVLIIERIVIHMEAFFAKDLLSACDRCRIHIGECLVGAYDNTAPYIHSCVRYARLLYGALAIKPS